MTYQQTLDYLYKQLPMYQRVGAAAFKKDLTNITELCATMGQPQERFPSLHIAGTNGKGSTAHMLAAVLQAGGRRVGLYTSPHYRDFRERIKISGEYISEAAVVDFVARSRAAFERSRPSFFEISVAMAFDYFARQAVDVAVIETGLGGRLDSTNVLLPKLSIITNISYDHMQFLGDTLPQIAGEKAGIIKAGVPVVIGETQPETRPVFDARAAAMQAPIIYADQHYRVEKCRDSLTDMTVNVFHEGRPNLRELEVGVAGPYQERNLQTVLQAVEWLPAGYAVTEAELRRGLADLRALTAFIGRWQVIGEAPLILCDSAHNEGGLQLVMERLQQLDYPRLHMVIGAVNDKKLDTLLSLMPKAATYYFARPDIPRGLDAAELQGQAAAYGLQGDTYPSVPAALEAAKQAAAPDDLIFIGGSTFVVAEVV